MPAKHESDLIDKSAAAIDAVDAAVVNLMTQEQFHVPTAREISKRSGYSVGTIGLPPEKWSSLMYGL